ncbi:MAG: hypothetical protein RSB72_00260, partial [Bacilli bacterium]
MMKLVKRFIFLICLFFIFGSLVDAKQVDVHLFWGEGCPHCAHEKDFLKDINKKYDDVSINLYEVWNNESNALLLDDVKSSFGSENSSSVPYTVVGNRSFSGYNANIGLQIENAIKDCSKMKCSNVVGDISKNGKFTVDVDKSMNDKVVIPIIGEVNAKNVSLPIVAVVIGFVDGFNPCAMWILLFLISVLIGIPSKKKRWLIGLTFLLTSAFVYFLFMVAWLNITLQIKDVVVLRIIIAFVGLIGGFINLRSYFKSTS